MNTDQSGMLIAYVNAVFFVFCHGLAWYYYKSFGLEYFIHADFSSGYYFVMNHPYDSHIFNFIFLATAIFLIRAILKNSLSLASADGWSRKIGVFLVNQFVLWPLVVLLFILSVDFDVVAPKVFYSYKTSETLYSCVHVLGRISDYNVLIDGGKNILVSISDIESISVYGDSCSSKE